MVASVVISALILSLAMTAPLTKPTSAPATRLAPMPITTLPVALETIAQNTPAKATVEPTERSKSRDARQNIMVQATMPICDTEQGQADHVVP